MTIQEIKQSELTIGEREILEQDRERYQKLGSGAHLDEWLAFYPGLDIRRRLAMRMAFTNRPEGKGYVMALNQLYADGGFDTKDKTFMKALTDVLWIKDDPERETVLREIRESMTPGQRSRLNSPISARQRVEAVLKARAKGTEGNLRSSPVSDLRRQLADKDRRIAELEQKLARKDDGSLFDLKNDTPDAIAQVIVANATDHRVEALVKALGEHRKRRRMKPAG